jgi:RNA polymerase sigma-70 factor (ECF subfamily)
VPRVRRHRRQPEDAPDSDEHLVALAQRGDREAFGVLYDRYVPGVYGYGYRLLGTREAAEDVTTEVFLRALAALPTCQTGSFRSWLFAIAHNRVADELRQRRPTEPLTAGLFVLDPGPSPDEVAAVAADRHTVFGLLPQLSLDQQEVVAMRLSGLSAVEIGEALGKPRNAVDGIHHRALLRLRALVATGDAATTKGRG